MLKITRSPFSFMLLLAINLSIASGSVWSQDVAVSPASATASTGARIILPDRASDTAPAIVETQYVFPSRKAYDTYIRDHAPALRADGVKHFPPESGVTSERSVAEIAAEL